MKPRPIIAVTACCFLALASSGCGQSDSPVKAQSAPQRPPETSERPTVKLNPAQLKLIRTEAVQTAQVPVDSVSAPGKVEANANRLSHVVLPLAGRVTSVLAKIGDFVRQGQPLLTIESADADAAVSGFQQSQASVTQAKSAQAKSQMDLDRVKDLFEHGAVPQKDVLNSEAVLVQAQAAVEQATASSEQARRRLQILGIGPGTYGQRVTISAPISGKVLDLSVVDGEFRNDLSAPLLTIADLSSVWVTSDVPESVIRLVKVGEPVQIALSAYPGEVFRGRVALIGDVVDPQTRSVKVRAELANPGGRLKPEMFGNIQLAEQTELRPTIPMAAVIANDGQALVWRQSGEGIFERVIVTTGAQVGDRVAIVSGLAPGDRVVVDGVMLLVAN